MRTYYISPTDTFSATLKASLAPGDVIELEPAIYRKSFTLPAVGMPENPVTIKGNGAILDGEGVPLVGNTSSPRGLFQQDGGAYIYRDMKTRNASNGQNAAGIRVIHGHAWIKAVKIRNCDMGVHSTDAAFLSIEDSDIQFNGRSANSHNIYLSGGIRSEILRTIVARTMGGQNVKVRTRTTLIDSCRILDSTDGEIHICQSKDTVEVGANAMVNNNFIRTMADFPKFPGNLTKGNRARVIAFGYDLTDFDRNGTLFLTNNKIEMRSTENIAVSLDSINAGLKAVANEVTGSSKLLRIRYGACKGNEGSENVFVRGSERFKFAEFPELFTAPYIAPPDTTPPEPPTNVVGENRPASIHLNWNPSPTPDVHHYEIDGPYGPFGADECEYAVIAAIYPGKTYTFQVRAVDYSGNSSTGVPVTVMRPA